MHQQYGARVNPRLVDKKGAPVAMTEGVTVRRARRLVVASAFAPPIVFDTYFVGWAVAEDQFGSDELLMIGGVTLLLLLVASWLYLTTRKTPNSWSSVAIPGVLMTLMMFSQFGADSRGNAGTLSVVATMIVGVAVASLPLWARSMVLTDPSPEIVESDLTIRFTWTEAENTEWTIPDGDVERTVTMPAGKLLGISVPGGQLVVAMDETTEAKQFIEARAALTRRRSTSVTED